ncbi:MAG: hypothetical protein ACWGO1_14635, partial [Anaerolineales bacterium]
FKLSACRSRLAIARHEQHAQCQQQASFLQSRAAAGKQRDQDQDADQPNRVNEWWQQFREIQKHRQAG